MNPTEKITAITNIVSASANFAMAMAAIYAAIKAKNFFKGKFQEVIFEESSKLTTAFQEIEKNKLFFKLAFPFRFAEHVSDWSDSEYYKNRVQGSVEWSISFQESLKKAFNDIKATTENIQLHNGKISKKGNAKLIELEELIFLIHSSLDDYHFSTIKLFDINIDKSFISQHMDRDFDGLDFNARYEYFDKYLAHQIDNIQNLYSRILTCLGVLKGMYTKGKLINY